jgi:hypothetical protein
MYQPSVGALWAGLAQSFCITATRKSSDVTTAVRRRCPRSRRAAGAHPRAVTAGFVGCGANRPREVRGPSLRSEIADWEREPRRPRWVMIALLAIVALLAGWGFVKGFRGEAWHLHSHLPAPKGTSPDRALRPTEIFGDGTCRLNPRLTGRVARSASAASVTGGAS